MDIIPDEPMQLPTRLPGTLVVQQVKAFYEQFSVDTLARLEDIYTSDVEFRDPVHTLHGCLAVRRYLRKMAANLTLYRIRYLDEVVTPHAAYLTWEMDYAHPRLKGGATITVRGMSQLKFTDKVYYHEDSYDLGALLYQYVPLLGLTIRSLKQRLAH